MYCINRNGWFHFRLRVPYDLNDIVKSTHIQFPLKTKQRRIAKKLSFELRGRIIPKFQKLRLELLSGTNHSNLERLALELLPVRHRYKKARFNKSTKFISELIESYLDDRSKHLDKRTLLVMKYAFDMFVWFTGDVPITNISRNNCREFRDIMLRLPPRALNYLSTKSLPEVLAIGITPMNKKTVNKNIQFVSTMFNWAISEELIKYNPARGLAVSVKRKASLERKAYDGITLKHIFSSLTPSDQHPENYWLPLLAYFTGLRIEELCQLRIEDIVQIDGLYCVHVCSEAGSLKTINAERMVPIHNDLIKMGFIKYVNGLDKAKSIRLWQELGANKYGKFSSVYSKTFGKFKREIGIKDRQLTFHSFRHTFANELKQVDVSEYLIAQLIGHSNSSMTMSRYGKEYDVKKLYGAISKLSLHK